MEHLSPDHLLAITQRTVVLVVRRPPTAAVLTSLEQRIQATARANASKLAYLHVVLDTPTTGKVDDEIRAAFIASAKRSLHHFDGAAMILMGRGFVGAAMRAAVSGSLLVVRPTVPVRIFGGVEEGVQWLASLPSTSARDPAKIVASAAELSSALLQEGAR